MSIFNVQLTPADLPQPPGPTPSGNGPVRGSIEFYGPGHSYAVASPNPPPVAEVSPVFGGEGGF